MYPLPLYCALHSCIPSPHVTPPEKSHCHEKAVPDFVSPPRIRRYLPTTMLSRWKLMYRTTHLNLAHGWNK